MIATLRQGVRRLLAASLAAVTWVTAVEAQQRAGRDIEVDRVVGVVGKHPILLSEVLEAINFARSRGLRVPQDGAAQVTLARAFLSTPLPAGFFLPAVLLVGPCARARAARTLLRLLAGFAGAAGALLI
ncbi:MAG: hypothetical protein ACKOFO_06615, partial [Gemmatimonadota bacterium]